MNTSRHNNPLLKISGVIFLIAVPVILVIVVFAPFIAGKQKKELQQYTQMYSLPPGFTRDDLREVVDSMRNDYELQYYFHILEEESVSLAVDQINAQISAKMNQEDFRKLLESKQAEIERLGLLFDNVEFSEDIFTAEEGSSQPLKKALWALFYEDFKLSIMGAIYKATYDPSFRFQWKEPTVRSATDLKTIFSGMRGEDLAVLNRMIQSQTLRPDAPSPSE